MIETLLALVLSAQLQAADADAAVVAPLQVPTNISQQATLQPPRPDQVMAIPPELRQLLEDRVLSTIGSRKSRLDRLMSLMFDEDGLHMEYAPDATFTVAEAYRVRKANCLTFTLMTIALAREAGLKAFPQEIERTLSWNTSGDGVFIQSMHVNAGIYADGRQFTIDVATDQLLTTSEPEPISDERLLSLYYNNRAMELMLRGDTATSGNWLKASLALDDGHASPWNNAGVVALRSGDLQAAEHDFLRALELNPSHSGALSNIVSYYQRNGERRKAEVWRKRAERAAHYDPLHQFLLGRQAEHRGDLREASKRYQRAARLDRHERLFQLSLARTWLQLGEHAKARDALVAADRLAPTGDRGRYQAKLDKLRRLVR